MSNRPPLDRSPRMSPIDLGDGYMLVKVKLSTIIHHPSTRGHRRTTLTG